MRHHLITATLLAGAMLSARAAFAWNATGHEVVAYVAWSQLTPETKAKVTELLRQHPDYTRTFIRDSTAPGPDRDQQAFVIAATWPDLIRSPSFGPSFKYAHSNWHYLDTPFLVGNVPAPAPEDLTWTPGKEPENAVQAYQKNLADLQNDKLPPADRAIALCWVEHLIGDIHQPLHAVSMYSATFPTGDRGGNSQIIKSGARTMNLHSLWDAMLGGYLPLKDVHAIADKLIAEHPPKEFQQDLTVTDFAQWAQESFARAKKYAYLDGKLDSTTKGAGKPAPELPPGYLDAAKPLAGRVASLGGYRLANVLNATFTTKPPQHP